MSDLLSVAFGELDIPPIIFAVIAALTLFTFLAVAISSYKLVQSAVEEDTDQTKQ